MTANKEIIKNFTYLGYNCMSTETTIRKKDLNHVLEIATEWMKTHYGSKFVKFELREDFNNNYISRILNFENDGKSHLNDTCQISQIGTQWKAVLYNRKII